MQVTTLESHFVPRGGFATIIYSFSILGLFGFVIPLIFGPLANLQ